MKRNVAIPPSPPLLVDFVFFVSRFSRASLKMALRETGEQTLKIPSKNAKAILIHSDELVKLCDRLPKVPNRVSRTPSDGIFSLFCV